MFEVSLECEWVILLKVFISVCLKQHNMNIRIALKMYIIDEDEWMTKTAIKQNF